MYLFGRVGDGAIHLTVHQLRTEIPWSPAELHNPSIASSLRAQIERGEFYTCMVAAVSLNESAAWNQAFAQAGYTRLALEEAMAIWSKYLYEFHPGFHPDNSVFWRFGEPVLYPTELVHEDEDVVHLRIDVPRLKMDGLSR